MKYLTGGLISDRRLVPHENGEVTFFVRVGRQTGGDDEIEPISLPGIEFVRRYGFSSEMVRFVIRPPCVGPHRTSMQATTATIAATRIATARKIEVTIPSTPGKLSRSAE